jgi:hypothetical protein
MIPKRLPVRSPKISKKTLCDCKYAVRIQLILKSQRQRGIKYPEEKNVHQSIESMNEKVP